MKLFLILTTISLVIFSPLNSSAFVISNPLGSPFGGRITSVVPCTCSGIPPFIPIKITIGPPVGGSFIYIPFVSKLYSYYNLLPPSWTLGTSSGRRECLVGFPPACVSVGFGGTIIKIVGTSLF